MGDSPDLPPLSAALYQAGCRSYAGFHTPGHGRGHAIYPPLRAWWGEGVFRADLPELPGLDNLLAPAGRIAEAQAQAAQVFGADQTWFLVNGATAGLLAAVLAVCRPGDRLLLPRNVHQAVLHALILADVWPVFLAPCRAAGLWGGPDPTAVTDHLAADPTIRAVLLVSPTYEGVCAEVDTLAAIAHAAGRPVIVDEAHGAHLGFHPALPLPALSQGADLVVQASHKTLPALTQAAMLHCRGVRIDPQRVSQALRLIQTSSPSYLLLASLETATAQMATAGRHLLEQTLAAAAWVRAQVEKLPGLSVVQPPCGRPGFAAQDPTRLTVRVADLGLTGFAADEILHGELGVTAELPGYEDLTFLLSVGHTTADVAQLVAALQTLSRRHWGAVPLPVAPLWPGLSERVCSPRQAFFAPCESIPLAAAAGRVSAATVCPYPPGIPLLIPGERISPEALTYLESSVRAGGAVVGLSVQDPPEVRVLYG
ncbi:MAG: aminotransferase class V-fold PLP-dependent enzyme [Gloeomargaritaceae cyanobacterium C42_A2020_066]|nr:aminotransferase class V-fold PLP-dependent enzyme [Gloeomargaritaceae cyanobacterium C42_A2020_066]